MNHIRNLFFRLKEGNLPLGRIEAFSDGIFAVAATLLVMDLKDIPLPAHPTPLELGRALVAALPQFLSWMISFVIVAKFWLNHHHLLHLAGHADYGMVWINSIFLMFQSLVPFPTAMMGQYPDNPLAVGLFGVTMAVNTILFIGLYAYILRRTARPEMLALEDPLVLRKSWVGPVSYLTGAGLAWVHPALAFGIYFATPLFFITPLHRKHVARPGR